MKIPDQYVNVATHDYHMNKCNFSLLSLSILSCFFFLSCHKENCQDLDFGDHNLKSQSLEYESGASKTALIFKDSVGMEHRYDLSTEINYHKGNLHIDSCEGTPISITHKSEYHLRRFSGLNNTALAYAQIVDFLDDEASFNENHLVDILKMSVFDDNMPPAFLSRICIMTSSRKGSIDEQAYNETQFNEHDSLLLLNKTFYHVVEQKTGTTKMYYTQHDGIVSFTDNAGKTLVFDHWE